MAKTNPNFNARNVDRTIGAILIDSGRLSPDDTERVLKFQKEAGLRLLRPPVRPRWSPYLNVRPSQRMASWQRFAPEHRRRAGSH